MPNTMPLTETSIQELVQIAALTMESNLNNAWSGNPTPSARAAFYLGAAESMNAVMAKPEIMQHLALLSLDRASKAVQEYKQSPWWKRALNLV